MYFFVSLTIVFIVFLFPLPVRLGLAMPIDEGDGERWAELPQGDDGSTSDDGDAAIIDHKTSLSADDGAAGTLLFRLPAPSRSLDERTLSISHDSTQGLAARVWPSAAILVEFIAAEVEREKEKEKGRGEERGGGATKGFSWRDASVLELGCGPGLAGIAAAALAGARVLLTDLEGPALTLARRNVAANAAEIKRNGGGVAVAPLPWGLPGAAQKAAEAVEDTSFSSPDAVIAADVIYDGALFSPLLETLEVLAFGAVGGGRDGDGDNGDNGNSAPASAPGSSPSVSPHSPPRILIAHVRRWKRDTRFWAAARKRFEVLDVTPGKPEAREEGGEKGKSGKSCSRYSSHEKGALRVFELVTKKKSGSR